MKFLCLRKSKLIIANCIALMRTSVALRRTGGASYRTGVALQRTGGAPDRNGVALQRNGGALDRASAALQRTGVHHTVLVVQIEMSRHVLPLEPAAAPTAGPLILHR